jgi:RimJ/RimL family protein N-acetyltransferase
VTELAAHLRAWIGAWPPPGPGLTVVAPLSRMEPGWDGKVRPLIGAVDDSGDGLVAVAPAIHRDVTDLLHGASADVLEDRDVRSAVGELAGGEGAALGAGVLRWATTVADDHEPLGTWLAHTDPRVPPWLHPFGGAALVALEDDRYVGGVGVKRHDRHGHELSVVVDEDHRGRGIATRLVATAARHVLDRVPVVTYLHDRANEGSARVADAVGFPDRGWLALGVFGGEHGD